MARHPWITRHLWMARHPWITRHLWMARHHPTNDCAQ
jgi:hypothetical protein